MNPPPFVANRTRARKAVTNTTESASQNVNVTDAVLLGHRDRKRLAGVAVRVSDCSPQLKSGFDRRKDRRGFVVIDEENEEEELHVVAKGPVAKRTRSRLKGDKALTLNAVSSASVDAFEFVPSSVLESVAGGSKSDGSGCVDGEKDRRSGAVDRDSEGKFRVPRWKFGFCGTKMGVPSKMTDDSEETIDLQKDGSYNSMIVNGVSESAGSCVARRIRSRKGLGSEVQMAGNPVVVDLDDKQSSNKDDPTISTSGHVSGASVCEEESCSYIGGEKGEIIGTHLKRKTYSGLSLLVPVGNDNCNSDGVEGMPTNVAKRTRSHCPSQPKQKIGTIRNPYKIDMDSNPSSDGTDVDDDDGNTKGRVHLETSSSFEGDDNYDEDVGDDDDCSDFDDDAVDGSFSVKEALNGDVKRNEREELRSGKSRERKRNCACAPKSGFSIKTLVDTILKEGEDSTKKSTSQNVTPTKDEIPHPLIFSFEDAPSEEKESSNMRKDEDDLWAEFNLAMSYNNICSFSSSEANNEDTKAREFEINPSTLCCEGKHEFILDEQFGIVCRFCPSVKLEIKHVLPSLEKKIWGKSGKKMYGDENHISFLGGLPFRDMTGDPKGFGHCFEGTVWDIVPGIKKTMYPHQQDGFEFMWKNLAGSISLEYLKKHAKPSDIGGCVISHAPGTGKTRLTIVFLQTFMEVFPNCRPIILAPRSMILTWEKEFKKWQVGIPLHILNRQEFSGNEESVALQFGRKFKLQGSNWARLVKICSWVKGKGILVLSYSLFERLVDPSKKKRERLVEKICMDEKETQVGKILIEKTGLLILDEGHTPRNERSRIWKTLEKMKTERRIILSGTPFQNNFRELYNTLCLVRPKFAYKLSFAENCQWKSRMISDDLRKVLLERREAWGRWASLTNSIGKSTDDCLEVLRSVIDPFVHVHKGSILNSLPGLRDCLIYLHPPPLQKTLLESIQKSRVHFKQDYNVSMISIHPSLLMECGLSEEEKPVFDEQLLKGVRLDPNEGVKTKFVMELVRLSDAMNEKVLVFSQYILPLSIIKDHLKFCFNWTEGKEILQMDGKVAIKQRQSSIDSFNDPSSDTRVLLASTKACCEGINLIGASRVVLLDVVWNPSVERQAISRAYRLGQQRMVYTYHLITSGTTEGDKFYRQVEKDRLSELIFSSGDVECDKKQSSLKISEDRILEEMIGHDKMKNIFEKILYQPKR